jgi:hypothetical protein
MIRIPVTARPGALCRASDTDTPVLPVTALTGIESGSDSESRSPSQASYEPL